jgi:hypothetical protein
MSDPPGLVPLLDAVDLTGPVMCGSGWRSFQGLGEDRTPFTEELIAASVLPSRAYKDPKAVAWARKLFKLRLREEAIHFDPVVGRVIYTLAERLASGEIAAFVQTLTSIEPLDRSVWRARNWKSYFVDGEIDKVVPVFGNNDRPIKDEYGNPTTNRIPQKIFVERADLERFHRGIATPPVPAVDAPIPVATDAPVPAALANPGSEVQPEALPPDKQPAVADPVQATPEPVLSAESSVAPPEPNRGGRPKDPLIVEEARRRLSAENAKAKVPRQLAPFARGIREWLVDQPNAVRDSKGEVSSTDTIEEHTRDMFWDFWGEHKK